jgi:hypothetical protein
MNAPRQGQRRQLPTPYRKAKEEIEQAREPSVQLPRELTVRLFLLLNELITFRNLIVERLDLQS